MPAKLLAGAGVGHLVGIYDDGGTGSSRNPTDASDRSAERPAGHLHQRLF
jgi:hypothetical protein